MPKNKRKPAGQRRLRTIQVDEKHRELTVTADHSRGMYLQVIVKDNKDAGEVVTAIHSPADVGLVEAAITRLVRSYLRNYPLVPPKGFYTLMVMPRWVRNTAEVGDGRD